jgi:hypothetical protein
MNRVTPLAVGAALALVVSLCGVTSSQASQKNHDDFATAQSSGSAKTESSDAASVGSKRANVNTGTKISAELASTIDARTAKPGDEVVARVTKSVKANGSTVVRKGDRLVGHVTEVKADGQGNAGSRLNVAFDRLVQGDATLQLNAVLTSVVSTPSEQRAQQQMAPEPLSGPAAVGSSGRASGGGLVRGVASTASSTVGAAGSTLGSVSTATSSTVSSTADAVANARGAAVGAVNAGSRARLDSNLGAGIATPRGAIHIGTQSQADQQTGASSILSTRKGDLRLEQGTRLQFRVAGNAETK